MFGVNHSIQMMYITENTLKILMRGNFYFLVYTLILGSYKSRENLGKYSPRNNGLSTIKVGNWWYTSPPKNWVRASEPPPLQDSASW